MMNICPNCSSTNVKRVERDEDDIVYSSFDTEFRCRDCGYSWVEAWGEDDDEELN